MSFLKNQIQSFIMILRAVFYFPVEHKAHGAGRKKPS
jgi:hypothetical protein